MTVNRSRTRCGAVTKDGKPCQAYATDSGLCLFHGNPGKAAEFGRIGGRNKKHYGEPEIVEPLPPTNNPIGFQDALDRLIREAYSGRIDPRLLPGLSQLLGLRLRANNVLIYERVQAIEQFLKETERDRVAGALGGIEIQNPLPEDLKSHPEMEEFFPNGSKSKKGKSKSSNNESPEFARGSFPRVGSSP